MVDADDRIVKAAPILAWTIGKPAAYVSSYFKRRGWTFHVV